VFPSFKLKGQQPRVANMLVEDYLRPAAVKVGILSAYSDDVNGRFQRDVNGHSGHVNKVGAQRRWDYNHARHLRD
jgi:hypothetical protein